MPRAYRSPTRDAVAAATRRRIVEAAGRLFVRDGYAATSMQAIAAEAGTSVQTVHAHGPKHALLVAAHELTLAGDEGRHPLAERPELVDIMSEPDTDVAIQRYVDFLVRANLRSAALVHAMVSAAGADARVRSAVQDLEERRHRDMTIAAGWFVGRGRLRAEQASEAADLLGLVVGPEPWIHLVRERGWTPTRYGVWLRRQLDELGAALDG
ncbi:AcrR family transcriptional regulator [Aeromicrobium sp. SORGH_AS981]|uniref:TetR/AcrR family transcriptional regulator n=1 Tax=Aeromicrobium sp. SORGH_AS_0981 TaxID=3041802 RepID=UPI0028628B41|nr:helix-turn-helix domain-containing protein [Aeromicrobium sp. SORGH_AS_0981]MDR6117125.1 AcrR family transcriptional regulator [Aeromicrobium sp. SORGH_AS_0981]